MDDISDERVPDQHPEGGPGDSGELDEELVNGELESNDLPPLPTGTGPADGPAPAA
ncbi:MAG: hypothetical protein JWR33_2094 [Naasia sp.]|jgi:hypothetical protein|uniref:hypothetical protein n=1 Tax=Naasia sp. TaxID=2546198 RepID=UPI00260AEAE8|nr:hypothetical protein [Naasia sp.]MCU1571353.1 hypothetical protein [Naasia sp.]